MSFSRKLRYGMIGGGRGAFIGSVHRIAAGMDGEAELVAGAFSSDPACSKASGEDFFLNPARVYGSFEEMAEAEAKKSVRERLDFVVIVTPNYQHYGPARLFLERGFNVVCDKPLAFDLKEALALRKLAVRSGKVFALTYNYIGNAMVKQARDLVRSGRLGPIRRVVVEYAQGWLSTALEKNGHKQAVWRTDPQRAGAAGCMGDIGTHAENLVRYITGLCIEELCADLTAFVPGRSLDDDGNVLLRFRGGAKGVLMCSQVCVGEENGLSIRIYGEKAGLVWRQEHPNQLLVTYPDRPTEVWGRGNGYLMSEAARAVGRVPAGHPEGYLEAFANVYREIFRAVRAEVSGKKLPKDLDFPTLEDGVTGMVFIETVVKSSRLGAKWVKFPEV